jgi:hypothetical protein
VRRYDWTNQWVLITGASSGIGRQFAIELARRGANLVLCSRNRARLEALADDLNTQARVIAADLEMDSGVDDLIRQVSELDVRIDHVVNNAGMGGPGYFVSQSQERQQRMVALNCTAVMRITRHFLPEFVERRSGGFIQVASTAGFQPVPFMAVYGATKAFVLNFTLGVAEELRDTQVRMMALCPGAVPTEFQERAGYQLTGMQHKNRMSAERVIETALSAYERGNWVCTPGVTNSMQVVLQRFVPLSLVTRAAAFVMKRSGRDRVES